MKVVVDIEANGLQPTEIWLVICHDLMTGRREVFREVTRNAQELERLQRYGQGVDLWIGHNILGYDGPVLNRLTGVGQFSDYDWVADHVRDTLVLSKLIDYPRKKHSIKDYGEEFGLEKGDFHDWTKYSPEMEEYCHRDVSICHRIYNRYLRYISNPSHVDSIRREHKFQLLANRLHDNGFCLDVKKAEKILLDVKEELSRLDEAFVEAFPPKLKLIREVTPKETKYGTISLSSIPKVLRDDVASMLPGSPFSYCSWEAFNPGSPKQVVSILNQAGWVPVDKTDGHKDKEREYNALKRQRKRVKGLDTAIKELYNDLNKLAVYGWKINENNLSTLPISAPLPARTLARRILFESRRKTLTEWLSLVTSEGRVHGEFQAIGAWTHRMSHQKPNMANITNAVRVSDGKESLLGKELRQCWRAPKNRLIVGVDAEAIQLRGFAHLINDPKLTDAIVNGDKKKGTDPHSLNKAYFGSYCKTRNAAKHSLYAMFFGGGPPMLSTIMDCTKAEAAEAIESLLEKYPGLVKLQQEVFPIDAKRGYFIGIDGRKVRIPGETQKDREHLCMSGYLQNFEKVIMSEASLVFEPELIHYDTILIDLVHDEWQNECPNDVTVCTAVAELECKTLVDVGVSFNLNCPLAGSYHNDAGKPTIGTNWYMTH